MDPPRHDLMRGLVARGFTPRRVADLEPRIRAIATGHIDRVRRCRALRLHPGLRRPAADGRHRRDARRRRRRSRPAPALGRHPPSSGRRRPWHPPGRSPGGRASDGLLPRPGRGTAGASRRGPDQRAARGRGRRATPDGPRGRVVPLPHDHRRQRDDHQAPRQRALLALTHPGSPRRGPRRSVAHPSVDRGDAALRRIDPDARPHRPGRVSGSTAARCGTASACSC